MKRRELLKAATGASLALGHAARTEAGPAAPYAAMLVYPGFTTLDMIGPQHVFASLPDLQVELVWKDTEILHSDTGVPIRPTATFADCPETVEILFVPGGTTGTLAVMRDAKVLDFLASRGTRARFVTSVCTGSLVLGAAGLLQGYKATSHWVARDLLSKFGAEPVASRVVRDRNRVTGAGVTAGIDFGLTLASILTDEATAKGIQLVMEYDPAPPFRSGNPEQAGAELTETLRSHFRWFEDAASGVAEREASRRRS